jgi:hypothetical protein
MIVSLTLSSLIPPALGQDDKTVICVSQEVAWEPGIPVGVPFDMDELEDQSRQENGCGLWQPSDEPSSAPIPVQFERATPESPSATAWFFVTDHERKMRRLLPVMGQVGQAPWQIRRDPTDLFIELWEDDERVLRYNHGSVPVPEGTHPHFAAGESYERGDYIHPLHGPNGEILTEDYPADHPHHRGIWWSWPVTKWNDQLADIWAVVGVWSRPDRIRRVETGPVFALLEAECTWKFGKNETPIVFEEVCIRAFRKHKRHRVIDVEITLTALTDGVSIGGRPKAGYGGFALRAAPCTERQITRFVDAESSKPRRAWVDYSGRFAPGQERSGVTIFEHVSNPDYPNPIHEYPQCNCVMPAYPETREITLERQKPLVLKHRLWIHPGIPSSQMLSNVWASYAQTPSASASKN